MSKFTFWGDLFKFSTEVLDEDYHFDKNYVVKVKTKTVDGIGEYALKVEQTKPGEDGQSTNAMELKQKVVFSNFTSENKVKTGGKVTSENEFRLDSLNDQFRGWSYVLTANLNSGQTLDRSSFNSSLKFRQPNVEAKIHFDHSNNGLLEAEGSFKPRPDSHVIVGGQAALNYKNTKLERYGIGFLNRLHERFSFGLHNWSDDGKNCGNFKLYTLQTVSETTDVSTVVGYSLNSKKMAASAGFIHRHDLSTQWKGKVNSDGLFALSFKHLIGASTTLTLSTAFDLGNKTVLHQNPHPFGIAVESKF